MRYANIEIDAGRHTGILGSLYQTEALVEFPTLLAVVSFWNMEIQKPEQPGIGQTKFGRVQFGQNRPAPSFVPASVVEIDSKLQEDAVALDVAQQSAPEAPSQSDAGASNTQQREERLNETAPPLPHSEPSDYTIPVEEILIRLREVNIEKSKDTVQRYCREGALDCQKLGLFKRFFATQKSVDALIIKMQPDEDARNCIQVHEAVSTENVVETKDTDAGAPNRVQAQPTADETNPKRITKRNCARRRSKPGQFFEGRNPG